MDKVISSLLTVGPSTILSILFIFSSSYFGSGLVTCSQKTVRSERPNTKSSECDTYKLADYQFINSYCYAKMFNYNVNTTNGDVNINSRYSLAYYKLYPYGQVPDIS